MLSALSKVELLIVHHPSKTDVEVVPHTTRCLEGKAHTWGVLRAVCPARAGSWGAEERRWGPFGTGAVVGGWFKCWLSALRWVVSLGISLSFRSAAVPAAVRDGGGCYDGGPFRLGLSTKPPTRFTTSLWLMNCRNRLNARSKHFLHTYCSLVLWASHQQGVLSALFHPLFWKHSYMEDRSGLFLLFDRIQQCRKRIQDRNGDYFFFFFKERTGVSEDSFLWSALFQPLPFRDPFGIAF